MSALAPDAPAPDAPAPAGVKVVRSTALVGHEVLVQLWAPRGRFQNIPKFTFKHAKDIYGTIQLDLDENGEPRYRSQFMLDLLTAAITDSEGREGGFVCFVPDEIYTARAAFDAAVHAEREAPRPAKRARVATE